MKELRVQGEFSPSGLHLGKAVVDEIVNGVELLHRIARPTVNEALQRFRDNFVERYEQEEVPLLQALDEDDGIHFPAGDEADAPPFCHPVLLRKLAEALQRGALEIQLSPQDVAQLKSKSRLPLPDAFVVRASVEAASEGAMARGDFRILLESVSGPSEAAFAEIVHLSEASTASDLLVSVRDGRIVLRSRALQKEVFPRLTTAHNYRGPCLALYRFLCLLQDQAVAATLVWNWGALENAPFLPRVTSGRLVLSRAQWRLTQKELKRLDAKKGAEGFRSVQEWRASRQMPRWVALVDADNLLPIDLDNVLSVEVLLHFIEGRETATLVEVFPSSDEPCVQGPEGRFVHELIIPFVRNAGSQTPSKGQTSVKATTSNEPVIRTFPPGSEWLYLKLYAGAATSDYILRDTVADAVRQVLDSGAVDRWFFIRYADPDWHLRLRLHGDADRLQNQVLPSLQKTLMPLLNDGRLWRLQLDTYVREVERYGGPAGIALAERLFHADSEAALEIIEMLEPGDEGLDERWRLTLVGVDELLNGFGFELAMKLTAMKRAWQSLSRALQVDVNLKAQIGAKFRKERASLEVIMEQSNRDEHPLSAGFEAFERRTSQAAQAMAKLKESDRSEKLTVSLSDLALSFVHMHVNRMLRSSHREQELVIYDCLVRLYESQAARLRSRAIPALE